MRCASVRIDQTMILSLLSYVRSGGVNRLFGSFRFAGIDGYGWSLLAYSEDTFSYHFYMYNQVVDLLGHFNRYNAFPVYMTLRNMVFGEVNL